MRTASTRAPRAGQATSFRRLAVDAVTGIRITPWGRRCGRSRRRLFRKAASGPGQAGPVRYAFFDDPNGVRVEL